LELTPYVLKIDCQDVSTKITHFIKDYVDKVKAEGIVLGLSGGVDSSVTAALSALAVGGERVFGLMLPEDETRNAEDIKHAKIVAHKFGIETELCDITKILDSFYEKLPGFDPIDRVSKGNIKARTRMICIYYYANHLRRIVCGSSDKSETMMGYFTKWGDVASDISPIMDLYKMQVRELARHVGIPREITDKPASPSLWPGQTAENELGIDYCRLDLVLYGLEHFVEPDEIAHELSMSRRKVEEIKQRWLSAEHKRQVLLTSKLGYRTVGADFRLLRG
jgi:NAD+ synthase